MSFERLKKLNKKGDVVMASVDYGVIVRTEGVWLRVKPRCPHCMHLEQSDWNLVSISIPKGQYETHSTSYTCKNCMKSFRITAYPG